MSKQGAIAEPHPKRQVILPNLQSSLCKAELPHREGMHKDKSLPRTRNLDAAPWNVTTARVDQEGDVKSSLKRTAARLSPHRAIMCASLCAGKEGNWMRRLPARFPFAA
jgi:hypothetical protein